MKVIGAENERLTVELTHRVGWEERALRAEAEVKELNEGIRYWMDEVEKLSAT